VVDLEEPRAPAIVQTVENVQGAGYFYEKGAALNGDRLAVLTRSGVSVFDVGNQDDPRLIGQIAARDGRAVALADAWLFVIAAGERERQSVHAYRLDSPALSEPDAIFAPPSSATAMEVRGERLVVVTEQSGIYWVRPDVPAALELKVWLPAAFDQGR
jgi:hypothetical protein